MALAPYFGKAALAAADILHGLSPAQFEELLAPISVGVAVDENVVNNFECHTLSELLVNLLARLYPSLVLVGPSQWADTMRQLALSINPNLEFRGEGLCAAWVCVGDKRVDGWDLCRGSCEFRRLGRTHHWRIPSPVANRTEV